MARTAPTTPLLFVLGTFVVVAAVASVERTTDCGRVRGSAQWGVHVFRSIPYAQAPIGPLRWRPPLPMGPGRCWAGTRDATRFRATCMQSPPQIERPDMSEDCLTLTVWTPGATTRARSSSVPTIVFFHGGDLMFGASSFYNFTKLVASGEAIVVAVNYRLSIFGWLAAKELRDARGVSGNFGLLDMQEALRWTQRNAAAFGGDPRRVTVLGQSSGGTAVLALLASPESQGLFARAISLSGSPNVTMDLATAEAAGASVVRRLGCSNGTSGVGVLDCLLSKSASELAAVVPQRWLDMDSFALPGPAQRSGYNEFGVLIVDGVTVPADLETSFGRGRGGFLLPVPVMIGTTGQEVEMCPAYSFGPRDQNKLSRVLEGTLGAGFGEAVVGGIKSTYAAQLEADPQLLYATSVSDLRFTCGNLRLARSLAATLAHSHQPVYSYVVTHNASRPWPTLACADSTARHAFHKIDLLSALGQFNFFDDFGSATAGFAPGKQDEAFGALLRALWIEFARTGSLSDTTGWTPALGNLSTHRRSSRHQTRWTMPPMNVATLSGTGVVTVAGLKQEECSFWKDAGFDERFWLCN